MDPENYDNYGGVEHLEYCFEVYFDNFNLCCLKPESIVFLLFSAYIPGISIDLVKLLGSGLLFQDQKSKTTEFQATFVNCDIISAWMD